MILFGKNLTLRRMGILGIGILSIIAGLDMIFHSCLYMKGAGCQHIESIQPVMLVVVMLWWIFYIWVKDTFSATYPLDRFENLSLSNTKYIRVDLIKMEDSKWINELKEAKSNKVNLIAYSRNGRLAAKEIAINLGLKEYFVDFLSDVEVERRTRKYN